MDDMRAFERQLELELGRMAGPGRRIDGLAMVGLVSTQSRKRRFPSMFSAIKLVVAGAVVALFGGFLLAEVMTQPRSDDLAPAASAVPSERPGLVYVLDGDIYVANEDGSDRERIVDDDPEAECSGFGASRGLFLSPDGRHLAVRTDWFDACAGTVSIVDLDGNLVASVPGTGWDIAWSPDGTRFATWLTFGDSIGVYAADGSLQAELNGSIHSSGDYDPRWTPDGTALLLPAQVDTAGVSHFLAARLPLDGGEPEVLPVTDPLSIRSASFSPDGTRVASVGPQGGLVVAAPDGDPDEPGGFEFHAGPGEQVDAGWTRRPLWSPNGDRIATVWRTGSTDAAGNWLQQSADLWVVDSASGSTMTNVASVEGEGDLEPIAFSPDGERILVRRDDGLSSVAIDGSGSTVLVPGADHGAWVPANARR